MNDVDAGRRRANRLLLMVGELHKRGYQRLRICPSIAPSGMYWRCVITPVTNILESNGAMLAAWDDESAYVTYTSGEANDYFGWGRTQATARDLADTFLKRLYPLAASGYGEDWVYAGWYVQMLGLAEQGFFPVAFDDTGADAEPGTIRVVHWSGQETPPRPLPAPPPGQAH